MISHENYMSRGVLKANIYTVDETWFSRSPCDSKTPLIGLAEIPKEFNGVGRRMGFEAVDFREVQPPMDIKIEELIVKPIVL